MTAAPVTGRPGLVHELFLYTGSTEMLEFVTLFAQDGVDAEEPTLLLSAPTPPRPCSTRRVLALPHRPAGDGQPGRPASDLRATDALLAGYKPRRRVAPQPGAGGPGGALARVAAPRSGGEPGPGPARHLGGVRLRPAHPHRRHGRRPARHPPPARPARPATGPTSATNTRPSSSPTPRRPARPGGADRPDRRTRRPVPATARATVAGFARHSGLPAREIDSLVFATHEAVTNALLHGRPPTALRLWAQPDRVTVTVTDTGPGPTDPSSASSHRPRQRPTSGHGDGQPRPRPVAEPPTRRRHPPPPRRRLHHPPRRKPTPHTWRRHPLRSPLTPAHIAQPDRPSADLPTRTSS